jgi:membrane-bound lytic murein transglycosylase D
MDIRTAVPGAVAMGALIGVAVAGLNLSTPVQASIPSVMALDVQDIVQWDLPIVRNESVQRFVDMFEQRQQDRMALYLERSGRYEGMIREKLRARGMPEDLVYLSMIESGFNPNAKSKAQAVGLWQFIADTGRGYGLRIDGYVDERRDPEKSTDAALRYLQDLYNQFGSWNLAAAAYNTGGNRVARIMREETGGVRGVESDFWRIRSRLPAETREYVPLIFAAAIIGKEPQKYGLEGVERWLPVPTAQVPVPGGTSLDVVAAATGVAPDVIRQLNPQLVKGATPPGQDAYSVRIPEDRSDSFTMNFERARAEAHARRGRAGARGPPGRREDGHPREEAGSRTEGADPPCRPWRVALDDREPPRRLGRRDPAGEQSRQEDDDPAGPGVADPRLTLFRSGSFVDRRCPELRRSSRVMPTTSTSFPRPETYPTFERSVFRRSEPHVDGELRCGQQL